MFNKLAELKNPLALFLVIGALILGAQGTIEPEVVGPVLGAGVGALTQTTQDDTYKKKYINSLEKENLRLSLENNHILKTQEYVIENKIQNIKISELQRQLELSQSEQELQAFEQLGETQISQEIQALAASESEEFYIDPLLNQEIDQKKRNI